MNEVPVEYVGFWPRFVAFLVDSVLALVVCAPLLHHFYGKAYWLGQYGFIAGPADVLLTWIFPAIACVLFWIYRDATPGKMVVNAKIVDAKTGGKCTTQQLIVRYLGYYVSILTLFIGFLMIAFDPRKQGLHDRMAGTVVIRARR